MSSGNDNRNNDCCSKNSESNTTNPKEDIENVLTNLKIISNLKPTDKLTNEEDILIIDPSQYGQGIKRWWNADSRISSVGFIEKLINSSFKIIDAIYSSEIQETTGTSVENNYYYKRTLPQQYFETENSQLLQNFSTELTNAIKGLQNLKLL